MSCLVCNRGLLNNETIKYSMLFLKTFSLDFFLLLILVSNFHLFEIFLFSHLVYIFCVCVCAVCVYVVLFLVTSPLPGQRGTS